MSKGTLRPSLACLRTRMQELLRPLTAVQLPGGSFYTTRVVAAHRDRCELMSASHGLELRAAVGGAVPTLAYPANKTGGGGRE